MRFLSLLFVAFALVFPHGALGAPSCSTKHKHKLGWSHHRKGNHTDTGYHTDPGNHPGGNVVATTTTTTMSTTTTPSSTPTPPTNNPVLTSQGPDDMLKLHNDFRATHGANVLAWSDKLTAAAKAVADSCIFKHSGGPFGENLAAGTGGDYTFASGFHSWVGEEPNYNPNNPQASHYTQVVWKSTTEVGCSCHSNCLGILPGAALYCVCEYNPPGNVIGEFPQNVQS